MRKAYKEIDMSEPLRVDVVFDFVCPWCYIGKPAWKPRSKTGNRRIPAVPSQWCAGCLSS